VKENASKIELGALAVMVLELTILVGYLTATGTAEGKVRY